LHNAYEEGIEMAHPRRRHYRVAQKAVEAQVFQHEDNHRRDSIFVLLLIIVLVTELLGLAFKIFGLFAGGGSESILD